MDVYYIAAIGVFGLLFGSFLNVCIYRIPRDLSVVTPRSFCPECGHGIAWYDNLPLLSYAALRGKCRQCRSRIGLQYPVVEFSTALAFGAVAWLYGWSPAAAKWMIFEAFMIVLFWTDLEERILPDELTVGGALFGALLALLVPVPGLFGTLLLPRSTALWQSLTNAALGAVLLAVPLWLLAVVYARLRHREGLGLGDVKLMALLGVFLGLEQGMTALLVGAVTGSLIGIIFIAIKRKAAWTYELPFGSFLCVAAALMPLIGPARQSQPYGYGP